MRKSAFLTLAVVLVATLLVGYVATSGDPEHEEHAPLASLHLSMADIAALNPAIGAHYGQISPCIPHMGEHFGPVVDGRPAMAPSVILSMDPVEDRVNAVEIVVPADQPWQPWFDQAEGEPLELAPGMHFWTQHVFLVDHALINECPPMEE